MADNDTVIKSQAQMNRCALALAAMSDDVAAAKQIKEFNSDRLKRAFSEEVCVYLATENSCAAAEHLARGSTKYFAALTELQEQYLDAMRIIERHDAYKIQFESARSILSVEKAKIGLL